MTRSNPRPGAPNRRRSDRIITSPKPDIEHVKRQFFAVNDNFIKCWEFPLTA
jgi:hypothetical protein